MEAEYTVIPPLPEEERIGRLIKGSRVREGLSQKELAVKMNIPPAIIGFWESNKSLPTLLQAEQLAEILHTVKEHFIVDIEYLKNETLEDDIKIIKSILPIIPIDERALNGICTADQIQNEINRCLHLIELKVLPKKEKGIVAYKKLSNLRFCYTLSQENKKWSFIFENNKFYFNNETKYCHLYWD